jgi:hypothetical protein
MTLVNFAHPPTPAHLARVEQLTGQVVERVVDVKTQFDPDRPFGEQTRVLVESVGLSTQE